MSPSSEHDQGFGAAYAAAAAYAVDDLLEMVEIPYSEADEGVGVAGGGERFHDLRDVVERVLDVVDLCATDEAKFSECLDLPAELGVVERDAVPGDDPDLLETIDAALGRGGGEADPPPDLAG